MKRCKLGTIVVLLIAALPCMAADMKKNVNERLLVIHATPPKAAKDTERLPRSSVYDGLAEQLTDSGYRIIDKAAAEQCSLEISATHDIDPFLNKAAAFGLKFFAEYSVYFKTSTIIKDRDDSKGALVKINAKVVDNTSAQVITSKTAEASSSGLSLDDAVEKAGRSAGKKLASSLIAAMEKNHREAAKAGSSFTIIIDAPEKAMNPSTILSRFEENTSISSAREVESGGGKATYEVFYRGQRDQLDRDTLKAAQELGWDMQKIRSEGNRSSWKIK